MSAQSIRIFLFKVHAWLGLNTCIVLGVLFATGTVLVFATEIEALFYVEAKSGDMPNGAPLTLGGVYDAVHGAYPDVAIRAIRQVEVGAAFGDSTLVRTAWGEKITIWTDPGTGAILGATPSEGFQKTLLEFHDSLFTGKSIGRQVVTLFSLSLLASVIAGLIAYRRFWRGLKSIPPRGRGPRPWWGAYHRLAATWSLPFLLLVALTGIYYFVTTLGVIPAGDPKPSPAAAREAPLPDGFDGALIDRAIATAQQAEPGLQVEVLLLPGSRKQGLLMAGPIGDPLVQLTTSKVVVDPTDMAILTSQNWSNYSWKTRLKHIGDRIHHGEWAGTVSRVLWLIFGILGTSLMVSGAMVYASRVARLPQAGSTAPPAQTAFRRLWRGMFVAKWGLVLLLIASAGVGVYRFAWLEGSWTTVDPVVAPASAPAKLAVKGALRQGEPLRVRIAFKGPAPETITVRVNAADAKALPLQQSAKGGNAVFTFVPTDSRNEITVALPGQSGGDQHLKWILGRPIL